MKSLKTPSVTKVTTFLFVVKTFTINLLQKDRKRPRNT